MTKFHSVPIEQYHFEDGLLMEKASAGRGHKPFAASSSSRWLHCALSVTEPPMGRRPSGEAAKEGTAAHLLLSWILTHKALDARPPMPQVIRVEDTDFPLEQSLVYSLSEMSEIWNSADEVWSEVSVTPFPTFMDECGGTADLITWTEKDESLHVCDFKYGRSYVSEIDNTQLLLYALGAIRHLERKPKIIHMSIFQPRASHHEQHPLRTWSVDTEVLKQHLRPLLAAIQRAKQDPEHAEAGEWCKWCDHQPTCAAFQAKMYELHEADQDDHDILNELGRMRGALKSWIEGVDGRLKSHMLEGKTLDTVKLVHGLGRRRWSVEESVLRETLTTLIRSQDADDIFTLKSVAAVEQMIPTENREQFMALIARGNPAVMIADSSDPRPAIGTGAEFSSTADTEEFV